MSAFLGPIHHWLYNKIQLQESLVEELLKLEEEKSKGSCPIREACYEKYGQPLKGNLEDIIDGSNIHGWLQDCITKVEYKLAYVITTLLEQNVISIEEAKEIFRKNGKESFEKLQGKAHTAEELYKHIFDYLLEGMPCDRVNEVIAADDNEVIWRATTCIHQSYWEEVGGQISLYYDLREAWLRGFLEATPMVYEKTAEGTQTIRRNVL